MKRTSLLSAILAVSLSSAGAGPAEMSKPVKVFILMGQSNMFGMGDVGPVEKTGTLENLVRTGKKYPHLLDEEGKWTTRKDVRYVEVMQGRGDKFQLLKNDWHGLQGKAIGPELQFGHIMGDLLDAPVLILKSCIGNRSLGWDLLPPGSERYVVDGRTYAGYKDTPDSWIEGEPKKEVKWYAGKQYDDDTANARKVLDDLATYYPGASGYRIAGFGGWNLKGPGLTVANAQLAVGDPAKHPEFAGNVKTIEARDYWKPADVSPNPKQDFHYYRNAGTYMEVGNALGLAMAGLLEARK